MRSVEEIERDIELERERLLQLARPSGAASIAVPRAAGRRKKVLLGILVAALAAAAAAVAIASRRGKKDQKRGALRITIARQ